jgi:DNA primase
MERSPIEEIKSRLDIVEVISSYLPLKKAGSNYKTLCPFHSEKNPSFFVSPSRQIWHCFGCNRGGNIFKFIMEIEGVEFGDALRILAKKAGVELKPLSPEDQKLKTERQRLYEICELACQFFERQLEGKTGKEVIEYLKKRGFKDETIKKWRIGWAPETKRSLVDFLLKKGYKIDEVEKAGLAIKTESQLYFDRFRGRIIFPIFDLNSQVVGFGGRIFKKEEGAKYINTPNTLIYDKSKILYGLDKAKVEIVKKNFCILVEGYVDTILTHQAGFENTVAVSGTALTSYQLALLKRYTENLFLAFDMDVGGDFATKRGIDLAQESGFNVKVLIFPPGKDPADVISENPAKFAEIVENSISILDFYFQNAFSNFDKNTFEGRKEILKTLLPLIKRIDNKVEQAVWVSKLSRELGTKEENVWEELEKLKLEEKGIGFERGEEVSSLQRKREEVLEERCLTLILKFPEMLNLIDEENFQYFSERGKEILEKLKIQNKELTPETKEYFEILAFKSEVEEVEGKGVDREIKFCLREIKLIKLKNELEELTKELKRVEEEKDEKKVDELLEKINQISKKLSQL